MKRRNIIAVALFLSAAMLFSLNSCSPPESSITGSWESNDGITYTFLSDETMYVSMGQMTVEGTYSVKNSMVEMIIEGETVSCEFKIEGNNLIMTNDGDTVIFTKK